jgi:hypothetical protein
MPPPPPTAAKPSKFAPRPIKQVRPKLVFAAVEGFGKTSIFANAPRPFMLMARGETGYDSLLAAGRVPQVPGAIANTWQEANDIVDSIIASPGEIDTLVVDEAGGFEVLCNEMVTARNFEGKAGDPGFLSYGKGDRIAANDWLLWLAKLERLNSQGVTVVVLSHLKTKAFPNPQGTDYLRYLPDISEQKWAPLKGWSDANLVGVFYTDAKVTDKQQKVGKGVGGDTRHLYTGPNAVMPSKNRFGMDSLIELPNVPAEAYKTIWSQIVRKDA